jgi:hypothetical protein
MQVDDADALRCVAPPEDTAVKTAPCDERVCDRHLHNAGTEAHDPKRYNAGSQSYWGEY